jgi:uncharacterized lipoprotein
MTDKITLAIIVLPLIAVVSLAACDSEPDQGQAKKEHVWKDQTGAIDKARQVETTLQRKKDQENQ